MKKQHKLPQQLPYRKSPRLSSSSSPAAAAASSSSSSPSSTRTRNEPDPRPDDAWALSLHVPSPQEDNSLRRSTRFASKTPPPQSRTSPAVFSSSSAPALTLTDGKNVGSSSLGERCLRSRTVLMKRVVSERRGRGRGKSAAEIEMLALPLATPVSRNAKTQLREESVELYKECSDTPKMEEQNVAENAVDRNGGGRNEESAVRSRSIQLKQNVAENAAGKADQKGGGRNEESAVRPGKKKMKEKGVLCCFVGEPIPEEEARRRWQWRYDLKSREKGENWKINADDDDDEIILNVESHYAQARVGNFVLNIGDCVFVKGEGSKKHIGRILEFFKTTEGEDYFRVQWFFRAEDTVLKNAASSHEKRRIFYSTLMNDNVLDCIISKLNIVNVPSMQCLKRNPVPSAAFYYDMEYSVQYSTFRTLLTETSTGSEPFLSNSKPPEEEPVTLTPLALLPEYESPEQELALLDLYSGCGGMSTGLCLGAKLSSVNLKTRWAVDYNSAACESLKLNHPETNVRNESAEDFLNLLKQWESLCKTYVFDIERTLKCELEELPEAEACLSSSDTEESTDEYEVSLLVDICYGDPNESGKCGLHFKVRWKGYGPDDDTWEEAEGLSNCQERIEHFVRRGFNAKILPLPGDVGVICGGPPCQGISGYNRHRNYSSPLEDERNRQIVVFMDIVEFLKPKYCLMENVVDIIRFDKGSLGRYALSRLVLMKYQARLGTIASGSYGLPQFRLRVFIWGAHPSQTLPQFPLPTHDVVARYWAPIEFERNIVAYDEGQPRGDLRPAIVLGDAISDLPRVTNDESREEMEYEKPPETEFQKRIRMSKDEMTTGKISAGSHGVLYDHRPVKLACSDYMRVCQIPHRKGANFRDLAGVVVGEDKVVRRDPTREPVVLPTGRLLVPDCVFTYELGKSKRPYGRLWWDETVSTVVTFPHIRAQPILHPDQDRRLTIRECARLQGFPDYYRFSGTIKERYCQIGNAVSMPVSRALGYALGVAYRKVAGDGPLMTLPPDFSSMLPSSS
ncbi:DNA (cytosine-5-)-methyltransferase [Salvia divinorum]|uniref:DNA (cytosine-5-)-methyltransferase n=1 Tax=Salvia divinorum TaxID=28513 RepID=A0ABD1FK78_SALDI